MARLLFFSFVVILVMFFMARMLAKSGEYLSRQNKPWHKIDVYTVLAEIFGQVLRPLLAKAQAELFQRNVISMLAELAKADGQISPAEIERIDRWLTESLALSPEDRRRAIQIFNEAKNEHRGLPFYAQELFRHFNRSPGVLAGVLEVLMSVSIADGSISPTEEKLMIQAAKIFGLSEIHYRRVRVRYSKAGWNPNLWGERREDPRAQSFGQRVEKEIPHHYSVLGCSPDSSIEEIKRSYRKLAKEHHPDRLVSQGVPPGFIKVAAQRFREIQEAYELVLKERG